MANNPSKLAYYKSAYDFRKRFALRSRPLAGQRDLSFKPTSAQAEVYEGFHVMIGGPLSEAAKQHVIDTSLHGRQFRGDGTHCDACRAVRRKGIDAGGYRGEGDRGQAMLRSNLQSRAIAGRKQFVLRRLAAAPDRADGVDHMFRRQTITARDLRRAGITAAERSAFGEQIGTGGAVDRPVYAAAAKQRTVRCIDDGIDAERRDVGNSDLKPRRTDGSGYQG